MNNSYICLKYVLQIFYNNINKNAYYLQDKLTTYKTFYQIC